MSSYTRMSGNIRDAAATWLHEGIKTMAIPQNLDTYITDTMVIEPMIGIRKSTMEPVIVAKVIDCKTRSIVEIQVFSDEKDYLEFVNQTLK